MAASLDKKVLHTDTIPRHIICITYSIGRTIQVKKQTALRMIATMNPEF